MCGIAGIYLKNKKVAKQEGVEAFCDRLLLEIEKRGTHATGYASVGWDKSMQLDKSDKPATEFIKMREPFQKGVQAVLLHTRFFTQGRPDVMGNNHPVTYNTCFAIHNGHISNDDELFKDENLKRNFEVDSEIIPALLDKHGLDTPEHIKEALEKFGGGMAIAAMDPVRNPARLLLARGKDSPLYVFETKNVIVWASTFNAIKDTWGDLIGTPPRNDKIKFIQEGKFLIADDYQDLGEYDFIPKKKPVYTGPIYRGRSGGHVHRREPVAQIRRPWDSEGPFNTRKEFDDALRAYRLQEDTSLARRWDLRDSYDDTSDFADVEGFLKWPNDTCCGHAVLEQDMKQHAKYGPICKDCYTIVLAKWGENIKKEAEEDILKDIDIPDIPEADKKNLESWSLNEAKFHRYTLQELSDHTGYTPQALDFLLFRTAGIATEFGRSMLSTKFALRRAYDIISEEIRTDYGKEVLDEVELDKQVTAEAAQEIADQQYYPWTAFSEQIVGEKDSYVKYVCESHGEVFLYGEHCHSCLYTDYDEDTVGWGTEDERTPGGLRLAPEPEQITAEGESCGVEPFADAPLHDAKDILSKCPKCRQWIIGGLCIPCNTTRKALPASTGEDAGPSEQPKTCCCKTTRDRKCKHKLTLVVENGLLNKTCGYCTRHWNKCSASKCNLPAIFTGLDGQRYCHKDSRRKTGIADASARLDGTLVITEVK